MAVPRKIYVPPTLTDISDAGTLRVQQPGIPSPFQMPAASANQTPDLEAERLARIAADNAEAAARIAADNTLQTNINNEASTRAAQDVSLQTNINTEGLTRATADTTLQTNIDNEATARVTGDTVAHWGSMDFSSLPTADPGGGKPWLKAGGLHVGP